jgi:hypothetical protein
MDIWYGSIGRGANLLLNFPVDRRGIVHENDAAAVLELRAAVDSILQHDLAAGRPTMSDQTRGGDNSEFASEHATDGDSTTYWAAEDGADTATVEIELAKPSPVNHVVLREFIPLGQRIRQFSVQCRTVDGWTTVAKGTTVGNRCIVQFPAVMANRIRIVIEDARSSPTLAEIGVYSGPPNVVISAQETSFLGSTEAYLSGDRDGARIFYTLDGSDPTRESIRYQGGAIKIINDTHLRTAAWEGDRRSLAIVDARFTRFDPGSLEPAAHPIDWVASRPGMLDVECYEGGWQSLHDLSDRTPVNHATADRISIDPRTRDEHCCLVFCGFLRIRETGVYQFHLASDDGSRLSIGAIRENDPDIDNDGLHGVIEKTVSLPLAAGWHPIRVEWFNATGDGSLSLEFEGPGVPRRAMRAADLASDANPE